MAKVLPVMRFKRFSAAFDEVARARLCESSGSEHSAAEELGGSADLSELVDSFLERDCGVEDEEEEEECCDDHGGENEEERNRDETSESYDNDFETKKMLLSLIGGEAEGEDGGAGRMIHKEVELAWRSSRSGSPEGLNLKRQVMSWLRQSGFDAGLCKSRWEKTAQSPAGDHEYIDIIMAKTRYIVDLSPATQFTIARPTAPYASLLQLFPRILVCKEDKLKKAVRLMCAAMRQSLKESEMHVPPWRRNAYLQAKWLGPYKRTTNPVQAATVRSRGCGSAGKSLVGFEITLREKTHVCCRGEVLRRKVGFGFCVGNLNAALNGMD